MFTVSRCRGHANVALSKMYEGSFQLIYNSLLLGPVYTSTSSSSKTVSFSMKMQRLHCIYTSFSYHFQIVLFGERFQNQSFSCRCKVKTQRKVCSFNGNDIKTYSCRRILKLIYLKTSFLGKEKNLWCISSHSSINVVL